MDNDPELTPPEGEAESAEREPSGREWPGDTPGEAGEPPPPGPASRRQPPWTYFLTPGAILIGAVIVAAAIWWTDDEGGDGAAAVSGAVPATQIEPDALSGAPADESTAKDLLTVFKGYATQVGIDQAKFQQCLSKAETAQIITRQLQRGQALGVNGTPTFFINNKRIVGAQPAAVFDEVIAAELKGSPTTLDAYSGTIKQLAASDRFEIVSTMVDLSDAVFDGSRDAKVVVAEFSDFQCPFCKRWNDDNLKRLQTKFGADMAIAFLHFPITQIHPNAGNAGAAAVCAGEQGKFWQMHDLLFARQSEWAPLRVN